MPGLHKNILFISLSNIGDTILTTPVLQTLHKLYPQAEIDLVSDRRSKIIYEHCPYRKEIFLKNKQNIFNGSLALIMELRKKSYDIIVDLRTDGLTCLLKGKVKLTKRQAVPYGQHAVEEHMGVIRKININGDIPPTAVWITDDHAEYANNCLRDIDAQRTLVIAPGCHVPIKVWSPGNFASLCNSLSGNIETVVLLGAGSERKYSDEVVKELSIPFKDLTGKTDLLQAAAVIKKSAFFIGNDSGLGHIASAVSIPSLTLFGIGEPQRYHPWGDQASWLQGDNNDINKISVDSVVQVVKKKLSMHTKNNSD